MAEEEKLGVEGEGDQGGSGMSAADAAAIRRELGEAAGDELDRVIEIAAASVIKAPTMRERLAAWLKTIGTPSFAPPIHPSRRAEVAALVKEHGAKLIAAAESGDDDTLRKIWNELGGALRFGGFSLAADQTPAALGLKKGRLRDVHFALQRLGYRADEINAAMIWANRDEANFGRFSWDYVEIKGERIDRKRIQLAVRPRWSKVSDEKWLSGFPEIAPPTAPPAPDWDKKLIVQD